MSLSAPDAVLLVLFLALSVLTLARNRIGFNEPASTYLPYFWAFFLFFTLGEIWRPEAGIWGLALLCFLALREYFSLVDLRLQDRWGVLAAYLAIPFQFYFILIDWYGMFIISVPVYAFLVIPFAVALGGREAEGRVLSVGVIDVGLFFLVYCIGHIGYLAFYSTWMALFLVMAVVACDLAALVLKSREKPPLQSVLMQLLAPAPLVLGVGLALGPWSAIPLEHSLALAFLVPALVAIGAFTIDALETDLGIDRARLSPGRGEILNTLKSFLYAFPVGFHYLRHFLDVF